MNPSLDPISLDPISLDPIIFDLFVEIPSMLPLLPLIPNVPSKKKQKVQFWHSYSGLPVVTRKQPKNIIIYSFKNSFTNVRL